MSIRLQAISQVIQPKLTIWKIMIIVNTETIPGKRIV